MALGRGVVVANQYHLCAHAANRLHLDLRRGPRHHDDRVGLERPRRVGDPTDRGCRRSRSHTAGPTVWCQVGNLVVGAPQLEAEDRLQILPFQQYLGADAGGQTRGGVEGGLARDVVDATGQYLAQQAVDARVGRREPASGFMLSFRFVMPIYEYECRDCRHDFEVLVTPVPPGVPGCASVSLQKRISAFAVGGSSAATAASAPQACGTCGDPRGAGACSMN